VIWEHVITNPRITYYDTNMRVMQDLTTAEEIYGRDERCCDECDQPAAYIGSGHRNKPCPPVKPQPPWFRCVPCYTRWLRYIAETIEPLDLIRCNDCEAVFNTLDEFSQWRPV
jgi:hypothetical protein